MAESANLLLDALNASAGAGNAAITQGDALNKILTDMGILNRNNSQAIDAKTTALNTVEGQALAGAQAAQDATRKFAAAAGSDITSPEQILIQLGNEMRANILESQNIQATIQAKESARIIDDPLSWLKGQLTLKQDYQAFNQAAEKANAASAGIAALTKATDEVGRTQEGLALKVTDASRAAAADIRIAEAQAAKIAAERGHLKDEMVIADAIQNTSAAQAVEAQRQYGLVMDAHKFDLEQQRFAWAKEQFDWEKRLKGAAAKDKKSADEVKAQMLQQYNIGARSLGLPEENNFDLLMARLELGGTDKTRISAAFEAGGNTLAAGHTRVASTPAGATAMLLKGVYPLGMDATFAPMRKYLKETWDVASRTGDGKEATATAAMNAIVKADSERYANNVVANGSFYAPPPIAAITASKSVQATPLYQKVLATAGKDLTTAAPTPIINLAYEAAKAGTITYEEAAAGLTEFYGQAKNINNLTHRYAQIGIQPQTTFKVKPDVRQLADVNESFDLSDYNQSLRMFAILKSRDAVGNLRNFMNGEISLFGDNK